MHSVSNFRDIYLSDVAVQMACTPPVHLYQFTFGNIRAFLRTRKEKYDHSRVKSGRHNVRHLRKDGKRER